MKKSFLIALFACFSLLACPYSFGATLSEMRTEIRRNLRDTDSTRQKYTDSQLLDFINQAQREIVTATWLSEETSSYMLTQRTTYYLLPDTAIAVKYVDFRKSGSNVIALQQETIESLKNGNINWQFISGSPVYYYIEKSSANRHLISYIPIPNATSTGTVTIRYVNRVDDLSSDSSVPFNNKLHLYPYHNTIVYYVSFRLKAIENKFNEAKFYNDLYIGSLSAMLDRIRALPDYSPGMRTQ